MKGKNATTPLMAQYQSIKADYPDAVLFFRLGDFYEMFDSDAVTVSKLLNLTLTHRIDSPMCGVPYHAAKVYIARLLRFGKKVAICEQVSVPNGKSLTERKVTEVITPGTTVEEDYLESDISNFIAVLCPVKIGSRVFTSFSWLDVSSAAFFALSWDSLFDAELLPKHLGRVSPRELVLPQAFEHDERIKAYVENSTGTVVSYYPDWHFSIEKSYKLLTECFRTANLRAFSLNESSPELASAGFLLEYASKNAGVKLSHITGITLYNDEEYLSLDDSSRKNLELTVNLRDGTAKYTLLEVINHTVTPMGSRLLRNRLLSPLTGADKIRARQDAVEYFVTDSQKENTVREILSSISDVERLSSRIAMDKAHAKDLLALRRSLEAYVALKTHFNGETTAPVDFSLAKEIASIIERAIKDDPSIILTEGNLIKQGWSEELDRMHVIQDDFSAVLNEYLEEEKAKTGIQNLKIRYNRVAGYYLEVTRAQLSRVPDYYIRRGTLVNADRFSTPRLDELEHELLSASEKIIDTERNLFIAVRDSLKPHIQYLFTVAAEIADLDVTVSHAHCARTFNWVRPVVDDSNLFEVKEGRHPVVEFHLPQGEFVPNDVCLNEMPFALITGPNMAGKSTYLRQNALITVLAQMGAFVPAASAHIGIVDRIFCRVGASDNLARGESTFLVEMTETANILRSASEKSLVIMDEVGRGTSTEDGLSIAWAISEYLLNVIKAKTLFATHYHELTRITHPMLQLLCLLVLECEGEVVFLKRIKEGATENSYGIHVARLAGVPDVVIERAKEILLTLQKKSMRTELDTVLSLREGASNNGDTSPNGDVSFNGDTSPNGANSVHTDAASGCAASLQNGASCGTNALSVQSGGGAYDESSSVITALGKTAQTAFANASPHVSCPGLFSCEELVLDEILSVEPDGITPLEALQKIARWKKQLSGR